MASTRRPRIAAIVAHDRRLGIGLEGGLPWHLPGDMKHFVAITSKVDDPTRQNAVVMGRTTYESIPERFRPLKGRRNIVISRNLDLQLEGAVVARDWAGAVAAAEGCENVFVIGGAQVYELALPGCDELYVTRIDADIACDRFFPEYHQSFRMDEELGVGEDAGIRYVFERWTRRGS